LELLPIIAKKANILPNVPMGESLGIKESEEIIRK
jgi:hypothetical protein